MNKKTIWLSVIIFVTGVLYLSLAYWLYYQNLTDTTGWGSIGIIAFSLTMVFPIYAALIGITGQIVFRKVWVAPLINSVGVTAFIVTLIIFMKVIKPVVLVIIPAVFIVTIAISFITKLISNIFPGKNKPVEQIPSENSVNAPSQVSSENSADVPSENSSDAKS